MKDQVQNGYVLRNKNLGTFYCYSESSEYNQANYLCNAAIFRSKRQAKLVADELNWSAELLDVVFNNMRIVGVVD